LRRGLPQAPRGAIVALLSFAVVRGERIDSATQRANAISPDTMPPKISDTERAALESELERLKQEHRDLDAAIDALASVGAGDQLQIQRLKKRKLVLRDRLSFVEDQLTPDIIA
jgi:hypothetical protein